MNNEEKLRILKNKLKKIQSINVGLMGGSGFLYIGFYLANYKKTSFCFLAAFLLNFLFFYSTYIIEDDLNEDIKSCAKK